MYLWKCSNVLIMVKLFPSDEAQISLYFIYDLLVVGYYPLLSVIHLGEHFSNTDVTCVSVNNKPFS